jgi:hypothetical protein
VAGKLSIWANVITDDLHESWDVTSESRMSSLRHCEQSKSIGLRCSPVSAYLAHAASVRIVNVIDLSTLFPEGGAKIL